MLNRIRGPYAHGHGPDKPRYVPIKGCSSMRWRVGSSDGPDHHAIQNGGPWLLLTMDHRHADSVSAISKEIRNVVLALFVAVDANNALQLAFSIMAPTPGARPRSLAEPCSAFVQTTVWSTSYSTLQGSFPCSLKYGVNTMCHFVLKAKVPYTRCSFCQVHPAYPWSSVELDCQIPGTS
jgi:hypothetical protein